jgi:hypothetical protein
MDKQKKNFDFKIDITQFGNINLETRKRFIAKRFIKTYISSSYKYYFYMSTFLEDHPNLIKYILTINIKQNNFFCTLYNVVKKKIILSFSAGIYKLNFSKKKHRFLSKIIMRKLLVFIRKSVVKHDIVRINLISPARIRIKLFRQLRKALRKVQLIFNFQKLICFNGCKAKKAKKKKRKGFRIFK